MATSIISFTMTQQGELAKHTRHKMKYRHRPKGRHLPIKDRVSIHERSKEVDGKRFGDFEMDLIVDPDQHAILTLVEKSTSMLLMQKLPNSQSLWQR